MRNVLMALIGCWWCVIFFVVFNVYRGVLMWRAINGMARLCFIVLILLMWLLSLYISCLLLLVILAVLALRVCAACFCFVSTRFLSVHVVHVFDGYNGIITCGVIYVIDWLWAKVLDVLLCRSAWLYSSYVLFWLFFQNCILVGVLLLWLFPLLYWGSVYVLCCVS